MQSMLLKSGQGTLLNSNYHRASSWWCHGILNNVENFLSSTNCFYTSEWKLWTLSKIITIISNNYGHYVIIVTGLTVCDLRMNEVNVDILTPLCFVLFCFRNDFYKVLVLKAQLNTGVVCVIVLVWAVMTHTFLQGAAELSIMPCIPMSSGLR